MAALLRRVAASAGVHMYEMEMLGELEYVCHVWIGQALDSLLGGVPEGMDQELAWESCIHPDDRAGVRGGLPGALRRDRRPRPSTGWWASTASPAGSGSGACPARSSDGRLLVDGIVTDITDRHRVEEQLAEAHRPARPPRLSRPPDRAAEPGTVPGAPRRGAGPRPARGVVRGGVVHRPRRVQADQRPPWPRGRRRGAAGCGQPPLRGHPRRRRGRAPGR